MYLQNCFFLKILGVKINFMLLPLHTKIFLRDWVSRSMVDQSQATIFFFQGCQNSFFIASNEFAKLD